jgi:hypothetical protein
MTFCGLPMCDEIYDTCLEMDNKTANRLLEYVPTQVRHSMPPLSFPE